MLPQNLLCLTEFKNFVVHLPDKVPLNVRTGKPASPTNPNDWASYSDALSCVQTYPGGQLGLGYVLSDADPFACIDLDPTDDPLIIAQQTEIFQAFPTYAEYSPSMRGCHLWLRGKVPSKRLPKIEIYSTAHYITLTGKPLRDIPIADCQPILNQFVAHYWPGMQNGTGPVIENIAAPDPVEVMTPAEMLRKCSERMQGDLFAQLWEGKEEIWNRKKYPQSRYDSHSEADLALCNMMANFTDNKKFVESMWLSSPLAQSQSKRKRKDWYENLVKKAFDRKLPINVEATKALDKKWEIQKESELSIVEEINEVQMMWTRPSGLIGQMADYIYASSLYPTTEVAVAAAITFMAAICGRSYNTITKSGLNLYTALLANSGMGKEAAATGIENLISACKQYCPDIEKFVGPFDIASPQALGKHLSDDKTGYTSFYSHRDEMGMWLQKMNDKHANQNDRMLKAMLLLLYHKSGYGKVLQGSIYSDRSKNTSLVYSPAFSILGDSTPDEFWKAIDERSLRDGLASRLLIINCANLRPVYNANGPFVIPSPDMIMKIVGLAQYSLRTNMIRGCTRVNEDAEAHKWQLAYQRECQDKLWSDNASPTASLWSRAHLKVLRLGALLAIGQNVENPIVTIPDYLWARDLVEHGTNLLLSKFSRGEVGQESEGNEQRKLLRKLLRKFWNGAYREGWLNAYSVSKDMHQNKIISLRYIQANTAHHSCFKHAMDYRRALKSILDSMCEAGTLAMEEVPTLSNNKAKAIVYRILDAIALAD